MWRYKILSIRNTSDRRQQVLGVITLGNVSVRAKLDRPNDESRLVVHAEHDDLCGRILLSNPTQQFEAREAGQIDIDYRYIGSYFEVCFMSRLFAGSFGQPDVGVAGEQRTAPRDQEGMIVDNEHIKRLRGCHCYEFVPNPVVFKHSRICQVE